jgi:DNA processing protein
LRSATLSPDSQAIVLLCSRVALAKTTDASNKPLNLQEWNDLGVTLRQSEWARPQALLGKQASEISDVLGLDPLLADRIVALLSRGGQLAIEQERLASRGIWILTRADPAYPSRYKKRLETRAPAVLFGAGPTSLLDGGGLAVVGSRDVDLDGERFARELGRYYAREGRIVVSGAARGVDRLAMESALESGGCAVGILADSLERTIRDPALRKAILCERLTLITPFHPSAGWDVRNAMGRNKLIYCLADEAVVVSSSETNGGTRAGALENLRHRWVPLLVRSGPSVPPGNQDLIARGATPWPPEAVVLAGISNHPPSATAHAEEGMVSVSLVNSDSSPEENYETHELTDPSRGDIFPVVRPGFEQHLGDWRTPKEVADFHCIRIEQARDWLKRGESEGWIQKRSKPLSYRASGVQPQLPLQLSVADGRSEEETSPFLSRPHTRRREGRMDRQRGTVVSPS